MGPTKTKKEAFQDEALELEHIYHTAPVGLCLLDRELRYLRINERLAEIHGKPVSEHIGRPLREVLPALAPTLEPMHRRILETGEAEVNVDISGTTPAQPGVVRDWLASHYPLMSEDGTVLGISVVVQEITDRKRVERKLRESEERLRVMSDALPALVAYVDSEQRYRFQNAAYQKWFGVSRERSGGRLIKDVLGERMYGLVQPYVEDALSGRTASVEVETPRPGGQMGVLQATLVPDANEDGKVLGFYVLAYDITDRKRTEVALARSEERLRQLLESTHIIPWEADGRTWRFTYMGPQAVQILGFPLERWYEDGFWAEHIHPEDRVSALEFCETSSRLSKEYEFEYRMISSTGASVWLHDLVSVEKENGVAVTLRGFMIDITERKQAEEALRESAAALRHSHERIQHLAGRLIAAQEAERKRVARELHDDVNQKLAALAITLSKMKQGLRPVDGVHDQITALQRRTAELADDVRRLSHRLHPATMEHVGLVAALKSYCAEFSRNAGIPIEMSVPELLEPVAPDVALCLYRVTQESLRNIGKHSGASEARLTLTESDGSLRLLISDTGAGFDVARERGTKGLGLVSMEERVRLVGGTFLLKSRPGMGTELEVRVPAKPANPAKGEA
jgi:PAS domain S-box-containing protein